MPRECKYTKYYNKNFRNFCIDECLYSVFVFLVQAEQFIDAEAEVTGDDDGDDDDDDCFADDCHLSDDSFIDDNSHAKSENISRYLKFIK